jgi:hypothetical protein
VSVIVKCDVCSKEVLLQREFLSPELHLPATWYVTWREGNSVNVCGKDCAKAYDLTHGLDETSVIERDADGEIVRSTLPLDSN